MFAGSGYRRLWSARTVSQWADIFNFVALALLIYVALRWSRAGPRRRRRNLLRSAAHQPMRPAPKTSGPIGVFNAITASKITATRDRFTHVADHPGHRHLTVPAVTHHLRGAAKLRRGRVARLGHATARVGRLTVLHRAGGGSWRPSDGPGRWAHVIREGLCSAVRAIRTKPAAATAIDHSWG